MFEHDYTLTDRLLHRLALGVSSVAELSFDLEQRASRAATVPRVSDGLHVFVTGLARAGTTVLLRHFHRSGPFRSLTYRDMPFVLAPGLWKRFSAHWQQRQEQRLRAHGDRVMVSADSPEALEEVFWRIFTGADYIRRDGLAPYEPGEDAIARFRKYVAAILASGEAGQARYLSKNNNNILRLPALRRAFPHALVVIPFRHPATQASSLWRQHRLFCRMQEESPFVRSYMDWLGHHEFGQGHRPFLFGGGPPDDLSPETPDYWLDTWIRVHETIAAHDDERAVFVCYEDLCSNTSVWKGLTMRLGLAEAATPDFAISQAAPADQFDPGRMWRAEETYARLRQRERVRSA